MSRRGWSVALCYVHYLGLIAICEGYHLSFSVALNTLAFFNCRHYDCCSKMGKLCLSLGYKLSLMPRIAFTKHTKSK